MTADSDLVLLQRWREGDSRAANSLITRYFTRLRVYFMQRVDVEHEDLVQETFKHLVTAKDRFRGDAKFAVYLFAIARRVLYGHLRRRYGFEGMTDFVDNEDSIADVTGRRHSSLLAAREEHRLLLDALRAIPVRYQELLELYYWQDLTAVEVGAVLGVGESTVRSRLQTALGCLRRKCAELSGLPHERDLPEDAVTTWLEELAANLDNLETKPSD